MPTGFERREVIESAAKQPRQAQMASVPGVSGPSGSDMSRVGEAQMRLADAMGKASTALNQGLSQYVDKKVDQWQVEGAMARAAGQTEAEITKTGNRFTQSGWQAMNGKIAGDAMFQSEMQEISTTGKTMDSASYQTYLTDKFKQMSDNLPARDGATRKMIQSYAVDMYPKLVSEQIKQNNVYNKANTIDTGRKLLVSTAETDGPEKAKELLDPKLYKLAPEEYSGMVASALTDSWSLGSKKLVSALTAQHKESGLPVNQQLGTQSVKATLDVIGHGESGNNYNAIYGGENKRLSTMTLNDVLGLQTSIRKSGGASSAVGKYQIINSTLKGLKNELKLDGSEVFDSELQDRLATHLLKKRGSDDYMNGKITAEQYQYNISQEWASVPKDKSGLSYYDGDGLNKANIEPGKLFGAVGSDVEGNTLYSQLTAMGMRSDDIIKVSKARDDFEREQSAKFDAGRLLTEEGIKRGAINQTDEQLIENIKTVKEQNGYSDVWANSLFSESLSARKAEKKEKDKTIKIQNMIDTNSVQNGSKEEQQKAVDIITKAAFAANPEALDPGSPNYATAKGAAMNQLYKFMYTNQITDDRMKSKWEVATIGDIVDKDGKVKPAAIDAYSGYLQAKSAVNDPLFAQSLLSDKTKDLFFMADSYKLQDNGADAEQALAMASTFIQKQNTSKGVNNIPWWSDYKQSASVTSNLVDNTIPGLLKGFGIGKAQSQMRWSLNEESVEKAASSQGITERIKQEASKLWDSTKHWEDQTAARELAVAKASSKVMANSEYVAGTFVYTGDQPSIASRIGMGGMKNATNMVTSRIMDALGPTIWKDFNSTDIYPMSQSWYASEPGIGKAAEWVGSVVTDTVKNPLDTAGNVVEKIQQKARGVPDFSVMLNPSGNALVLSPFTNLDRTQQGAPFIISIDKMKEAAAYLNKGDEAGFQRWAEAQKPHLPKY